MKQYILPLFLVLGATLSATPVTFSTGNFYQSGIGNEMGAGSVYDIVSVRGVANSTLDVNDALTATIGMYSFTVGVNCYSCSQVVHGNADIGMTVGGVTKQLHIPFTWSSQMTTDQLVVDASAPLLFDLGNGRQLIVSTLSLGTLAAGGGTVSRLLQANFRVTPEQNNGTGGQVPEPSTYALIGGGLTGLVFLRRKHA